LDPHTEQQSTPSGAASAGARPRLLTPAQAAVFLTLRESTLRDYARRGVVPSVKLGRHVRFIEADLVAHLEALRHGGPVPPTRPPRSPNGAST